MTQNDDKQSLTLPLRDDERSLPALLDDLPLVPRPWALVADRIHWPEGQLLETLTRWSDAGRLRRVQAIFNSSAVGFESTLVGIAVGTDEADRIADMISALPSVSHNFLREGAELNLWFTLTCPIKGPSLEQTLDDLGRKLARPVRRLDTTRFYKISFRSLFHDGARPAWGNDAEPIKEQPAPTLLKAIDLLQDDLPLVSRPFRALANHTDLTEDEMIDSARLLKRQKIIRRIGAIWNLVKLGVGQTVMCVWDLPEDELDRFARQAADRPQISHCYQRKHYPDWPWKLYTIVHGRDRLDCIQAIDKLSERFPRARHLAMWTVKEYKQSPVKYAPDKIVLKLACQTDRF